MAAATDVEGFYAARRPEHAPSDLVLAMSANAKGVVMRPEALRPATRQFPDPSGTVTKTCQTVNTERRRLMCRQCGRQHHPGAALPDPRPVRHPHDRDRIVTDTDHGDRLHGTQH